MLIRVGGIDDCDLINGGTNNVSHTIFVAGCSRKCPGCHNPELQPKGSGTLRTTAELVRGIKENTLATCVVITGGEPLEQVEAIKDFILAAHLYGKMVYLYTGYEIDDIPTDILNALHIGDIIKTGWYDETRKSPERILASANQQYYRKGEYDIWMSL